MNNMVRFLVNPPFGQLELYVFGQDWPRAIRPTENSVNKGPTLFFTENIKFGSFRKTSPVSH